MFLRGCSAEETKQKGTPPWNEHGYVDGMAPISEDHEIHYKQVVNSTSILVPGRVFEKDLNRIATFTKTLNLTRAKRCQKVLLVLRHCDLP